MTTQEYISTEYQGGLPRIIGQSPVHKFTGKERDAETGYVPNAFGIDVRYYSSDLSVWLSRKLSGVNPLGFARPNNSPYSYVQLKPIIRKDPNGIAAAGPIGAMFDIGGVSDSYGNTKLYFTMGWAMGMGASGGRGYGKTAKQQNSDFYEILGATMLVESLHLHPFQIQLDQNSNKSDNERYVELFNNYVRFRYDYRLNNKQKITPIIFKNNTNLDLPLDKDNLNKLIKIRR